VSQNKNQSDHASKGDLCACGRSYSIVTVAGVPTPICYPCRNAELRASFDSGKTFAQKKEAERKIKQRERQKQIADRRRENPPIPPNIRKAKHVAKKKIAQIVAGVNRGKIATPFSAVLDYDFDSGGRVPWQKTEQQAVRDILGYCAEVYGDTDPSSRRKLVDGLSDRFGLSIEFIRSEKIAAVWAKVQAIAQTRVPVAE
jgi:hypothetical protein